MRQSLTHRLVIALSLLLGAAVAYGWSGTPWWSEAASETAAEAQTAHPHALSVRARPLARQDHYLRSTRYTGQLRAARVVESSFERPGRVVAVHVEQGAHVKMGQRLASLDCRRLNAQREEVLARRDGAQAQLDELKAGPRPEAIAAARAEVRQLEADRDLMKADLGRATQLLERRAVSRSEHDQMRFGAAAAEARLVVAQRNLDELLAGSRHERIAAQAAMVRQLDATAEQLEIDLQDSVIEAPFDAIVSQRMVDEGEIVSSESTILRLLEDAPLEAWIGMPVHAARLWAPGRSTVLRVEDAHVKAVVQSVLPEIDPKTRTQTVVFRLEDDETTLLRHAPGMIVQAATEEQIDEAGFWVPTSALGHGTRGLWSLGLAVKGSDSGHYVVERIGVEILHQERDLSFVQETAGDAVEDGALVIVGGLHRVVDGQAISVDLEQAEKRLAFSAPGNGEAK